MVIVMTTFYLPKKSIPGNNV